MKIVVLILINLFVLFFFWFYRNEKRCEDNMRPLVERIKQIDRLKNEYETTINQKATESTKAQSELEKLHDQTDVLHGKLREAKADLDVCAAISLF